MTSIFTILTTSYNNFSYLETWMESIILQKYRPLRVSFVNDFSSDETDQQFYKYAQKLANEDIQVSYKLNNKRMHYGNCLKIAYDMSGGDFFGCLDADDGLLPNAVSTVMDHYNKYPEIGYIYTQFMTADINLKPLKRGFSSSPPAGSCLLSEGKRNKHCYSHFRTFSKRIEKIDKIWGLNMRCAVDKFMGYRLEELAHGMFINHPFYLWRTGRKDSIGNTEPSKAQWHKVMREAVNRRRMWNLSPKPIVSVSI